VKILSLKSSQYYSATKTNVVHLSASGRSVILDSLSVDMFFPLFKPTLQPLSTIPLIIDMNRSQKAHALPDKTGEFSGWESIN
jgi:hypothetical protein